MEDLVASDGVSPEGPVDTLSPQEAKESRSLEAEIPSSSSSDGTTEISGRGLEMKAEES